MLLFISLMSSPLYRMHNLDIVYFVLWDLVLYELPMSIYMWAKVSVYNMSLVLLKISFLSLPTPSPLSVYFAYLNRRDRNFVEGFYVMPFPTLHGNLLLNATEF